MNKFEYFKKKYPDMIINNNCISLFAVGRHIHELKYLIEVNIYEQSVYDEFIVDFNNTNIEYNRDKILEELFK